MYKANPLTLGGYMQKVLVALVVAIVATVLLPWIFLIGGALLALLVGGDAIKYAIIGLLEVCRWIVMFVDPRPEPFLVMMLCGLWGAFGMIGVVSVGMRHA